MKNIIRTSTLALAFIGGVGLAAAPALAASIHNEGRFGGSWSRIGPSDAYRNHRYSQRIMGRATAPTVPRPTRTGRGTAITASPIMTVALIPRGRGSASPSAKSNSSYKFPRSHQSGGFFGGTKVFQGQRNRVSSRAVAAVTRVNKEI